MSWLNEKDTFFRYGNSEGSDEPAHPHSLTSAFAVHSQCLALDKKSWNGSAVQDDLKDYI